jgi:hypothetical protein
MVTPVASDLRDMTSAMSGERHSQSSFPSNSRRDDVGSLVVAPSDFPAEVKTEPRIRLYLLRSCSFLRPYYGNFTIHRGCRVGTSKYSMCSERGAELSCCWPAAYLRGASAASCLAEL